MGSELHKLIGYGKHQIGDAVFLVRIAFVNLRGGEDHAQVRLVCGHAWKKLNRFRSISIGGTEDGRDYDTFEDSSMENGKWLRWIEEALRAYLSTAPHNSY